PGAPIPDLPPAAGGGDAVVPQAFGTRLDRTALAGGLWRNGRVTCPAGDPVGGTGPCRRAGYSDPGGLNHIGPLLMKLGNAEQRSRHLPAIIHGDAIWCQGYSEPGA